MRKENTCFNLNIHLNQKTELNHALGRSSLAAFDDEETRSRAKQLLKKDHPDTSADDYDLHVISSPLPAPPVP